MTPRRAVLGGLAAGALVGLVLVALAVALLPVVAAPGPTPQRSPSPTVPPASAAPASPSPTASSGAEGSVGAEPGPATSPGAPPLTFMVGEPAPSLVVPQLGGGAIDLAALRGRPVWLTFMATWCPSCREELPRMALAAARHAADGLVVLAVDVGGDEGTVAAYFAGLGVTLPVGLDPDGIAMDRWRVLALPVHFWIDAEGIVRFGALGGVGPDVFEAGLGTIVPGSGSAP